MIKKCLYCDNPVLKIGKIKYITKKLSPFLDLKYIKIGSEEETKIEIKRASRKITCEICHRSYIAITDRKKLQRILSNIFNNRKTSINPKKKEAIIEKLERYNIHIGENMVKKVVAISLPQDESIIRRIKSSLGKDFQEIHVFFREKGMKYYFSFTFHRKDNSYTLDDVVII